MTNKFSVTQNGEQLDSSKYIWNEKEQSFSTEESGLVLDFSDWDGVTFRTGSDCIFITGSGCDFRTKDNCKFTAGDYCLFKTGVDCTFITGWDCTFITGGRCEFRTRGNCVFNTGHECNFTTGANCTFYVDDSCIFNNIKMSCVINRRDLIEGYVLPKGKSIELNGHETAGYMEILGREELFQRAIKKLETISDDDLRSFLEQ